jgi:hypothetical protein
MSIPMRLYCKTSHNTIIILSALVMTLKYSQNTNETWESYSRQVTSDMSAHSRSGQNTVTVTFLQACRFTSLRKETPCNRKLPPLSSVNMHTVARSSRHVAVSFVVHIIVSTGRCHLVVTSPWRWRQEESPNAGDTIPIYTVPSPQNRINKHIICYNWKNTENTNSSAFLEVEDVVTVFELTACFV